MEVRVGIDPESRLFGAPRVPRRCAGVFGIGAALPERRVTNAELEQHLDTSDEWIVRRTGIRERRFLAADAPLAELAAEACRGALADAGRQPHEVDHVIACTITPDQVTPGLAPSLAARLELRVPAVDLNAACAGFVYGVDQAAALVETGRAEVVLVCAAEALSRLTDHADRGTAVLFGDGAGAVVVAAGDLDVGCPRFVLGADNEHPEMLYADHDERALRMDGQGVYRHAVRRMGEAMREAVARAGTTIDELDLLVAHQANARIVETVAAELGLPPEKAVLHLDKVANTSSASIPLALWQAEQEGRLRPGHTVGLVAFGAGFVWGAGVIGWKERSEVYV